jgi:hypothetical protein
MIFRELTTKRRARGLKYHLRQGNYLLGTIEYLNLDSLEMKQ